MADRINVSNRTLFIGDNLEFLRGINSDSIDLIYMDPPRNSGEMLTAPAGSKAEGVFYQETWTLAHMSSWWLDEIALRHPDVHLAITYAKSLHGPEMGGYLTYLGIRLVELQRVMKPSGSIYLHTDPHSSHYLKTVMDALFGREHFRNEIVWKRPRSTAGDKRWAWTHDSVLFYTGPRKYHWKRIFQPHSPDYWTRNYKHEDDGGQFYMTPLMSFGIKADDTGRPWREIDPAKMGKHWVPPVKYLRKAHPKRKDLHLISAQEKLEMLDELGLIEWSAGSIPRFKIYAEMTEGTTVEDTITLVEAAGQGSEEYTGWPGQKPEELLDLIIRASTWARDGEDDGGNPRRPPDIVLDPFCGSGTACVVAERLGRRWIGAEMAPEAERVLRTRLSDEHPGAGDAELSVRSDPPERTDLRRQDDGLNPFMAKFELYRRQRGRCLSCNHELPEHALVIDRVSKPYRRRPDTLANFQLLCHHCRSLR